MRSVVVARADEIAPGERKLVRVGGRSIGVFNVGGEYYALRNRCPHQGGPLCEGFQFAPLRAAGPGEYARGAEGEIIATVPRGFYLRASFTRALLSSN